MAIYHNTHSTAGLFQKEVPLYTRGWKDLGSYWPKSHALFWYGKKDSPSRKHGSNLPQVPYHPDSYHMCSRYLHMQKPRDPWPWVTAYDILLHTRNETMAVFIWYKLTEFRNPVTVCTERNLWFKNDFTTKSDLFMMSISLKNWFLVTMRSVLGFQIYSYLISITLLLTYYSNYDLDVI